MDHLEHWRAENLETVRLARTAGIPGHSALLAALLASGCAPDPQIRNCMADFGAIRAEMLLDRRTFAERLGIPETVAFAIEMGWRRLDVVDGLWCTDRLGVPFSSMFLDSERRIRPLTRLHAAFLRDDEEVERL